jgi:hypothetical protein
MLDKTSEGFISMIEGGTDTEHFAALYLSYLCDPPDYRGADKHYNASAMWKALQSAIDTVRKIQNERKIALDQTDDNFLNICTCMCSSSFCSQFIEDRSGRREPPRALLPIRGWA